MKKNILVLACLAAVITSCQKEDQTVLSTNETSGTINEINNAPAAKVAYAKKVLVESFVGTSYGDAPEVTRMLSNFCKREPTRIILAAHHNNDFLESMQTDPLAAGLANNGATTYPSAMIDR